MVNKPSLKARPAGTINATATLMVSSGAVRAWYRVLVSELTMSEQGRVVMNDAAPDGELDLGAVGRALVRKKWWVLGPALAIAALTFVGVNLITPKYKS